MTFFPLFGDLLRGESWPPIRGGQMATAWITWSKGFLFKKSQERFRSRSLWAVRSDHPSNAKEIHLAIRFFVSGWKRTNTCANKSTLTACPDFQKINFTKHSQQKCNHEWWNNLWNPFHQEDSWMYPYQRTLMGNPYVGPNSGYLWVIMFKNPKKNTQ